MKNYVYKEQKVTTKKLAGIYDAAKHVICVDGVDRDILKEFDDFDGSEIEFAIKIKEETDLLDSYVED